MKKITLSFLLIFSIFFSCKKQEKRVIIEKVKLEKGETFDNHLKKYKVVKNFGNDNYKFVLASRKDDSSRLLFYTQGLKKDVKELLRFRGNILNIFVADINNDSYKELYITSAPLKGKTYETVADVDIFGYTLNNDKKVARIKTEDIEDLEDFNTDKVNLKNNILSRTYIDNDKEQTYNYELSKDYKLIPKKVN